VTAAEFALTAPESESIGQRLLNRREAAGLSIAAAAAKLRCDPEILTLLEADRFDKLGAPVFARGHLRRYAELVGAPVSDLLLDWAKSGVRPAIPDLKRPVRIPRPSRDRDLWSRRLAGLAGAVVIAVSAWWILRGGGLRVPPVVAPVVAPLPAPAAPLTRDSPAVPPTERSSSASPTAPLPATSGAAASPTVASVEPPAPQPAPPVAPQPAPPVASLAAGPAVPGRVVLSLEVRADCWTEIFDATGRKLYFDVLPAGRRATVAGVAPLRVRLGRADQALLRVGGKAFALPPALIRNTTAYFAVDAAAQVRDLPRSTATP